MVGKIVTGAALAIGLAVLCVLSSEMGSVHTGPFGTATSVRPAVLMNPPLQAWRSPFNRFWIPKCWWLVNNMNCEGGTKA